MDNLVFDEQIKELLDIIDACDFQDMADEYIAQAEKLKADLAEKKQKEITAYIRSLKRNIETLTKKIVKRFSPHNEHLTESYLENLIATDGILLTKLKCTTKIDDCTQQLKAKAQYTLEYQELLHSFPEVCSLPANQQEELRILSMHLAELNYLFHQHWTVKF